MLFSCLVDADRLDTAARTVTQESLRADERLKTLLRHVSQLTGGSEHVKNLHTLLINLLPASGLNQPGETSPNTNGLALSFGSDIITIPVPQNDTHSDARTFEVTDELPWGEDFSIDAEFWEEGYRYFDINAV